jgi:hypothetical protein
MNDEKENPFLVLTVRCAAPGCINVRREANHWFLTSVKGGVFTCRRYTPRVRLQEGDAPVCGQACAQKVFEKFLAEKG